MAINSYFFNAVQTGDSYDRTYSAEDFCKYLELLVSNGVFANPATNMQVRAGSGMNVIVAPGQGWIAGHKIENTNDVILDIGASDVVLDRVDAVIFYVDHTTRKMGIEVKANVANSVSQLSNSFLTRTENRYELALAAVTIPKQATAIQNMNISDLRGDNEYCGYVTGLIDQINTTDLFQQYDDAFNAFIEEAKDGLLAGGAAVRKYSYTYTTVQTGQGARNGSFNVAEFIPEYNFALDALEIKINGLSLRADEYTQSGATVNLKAPWIITAGEKIEFVVYKSVKSE